MRTIFSPLTSSYLGYDSFFDEISRLLDNQQATTATGSGFPPFNLYKDGENYTIELAVAGFQGHQLTIEHDEQRHLLTIKGDASPTVPNGQGWFDEETELKRQVIKQGIAQRHFTRTFTLADNLKVEAAKLENGLLTIHLQVDEGKTYKPRRIPLQDPWAEADFANLQSAAKMLSKDGATLSISDGAALSLNSEVKEPEIKAA